MCKIGFFVFCCGLFEVLELQIYKIHATGWDLIVFSMVCVLLDSEQGTMWDLWALDWVQQKAECLRFCIGRSVTHVGQLPVSADIEYEFGTRNPYNFLQVTYYKVSHSLHRHKELLHNKAPKLSLPLPVLCSKLSFRGKHLSVWSAAIIIVQLTAA